jgi:hypothetical protein
MLYLNYNSGGADMYKRIIIFITLIVVCIVSSADTLRLSVIYNTTIDDNEATNITIRTLEAANPGDEVYIYLTSGGGRTDIGYKIVDAIKHSKGKVVIVVKTWAGSMAANLICESPNYIVDDKAILMYHMAFYIDDDGNKVPLNLNDPVDKAIFDRANQTFRNCGFLTEAEIIKIGNGGEVWLTGKEIYTRLKKMGINHEH